MDTYYPYAPDAANATLLDLAAGSELRGIEIQMRREAVFSIRGAVVDSAGKPTAASVNTQSAHDPEIGLGNASTNSSPDGTFELRNLLPGAYIITASPINSAEPAVAREEVSIGDSDITGVKLTLTQGATVTGTIKVEGAGSLGSPIIILVAPDRSFRNVSNSQAKEDGTFELRGVVPAIYAATALALPDGAYVKSVHFAGQDVTRMPIDLTSGVSGTLDILISPRGAELLGTVRNQDGATIPGVKVTCWPKNDSPYNLTEACGSVADQNGDFQMAGLAPGDYYIAAWEDLDPGLSDDSEFLRRFTSKATLVTVEEGSHQSVQPKLISREAAAAEAAKLQ
ncbi:MAG: carboxypeptidase-like regulatory domain-containing protein [Acidobacteriota bacterium]